MSKPTYHNKLVRDKIPDILREKGVDYAFRTADRAEYRKKLIEKLTEETKEFEHAPSEEELADILQVVIDIAADRKWSLSTIEKARVRKLNERGGFSKRIILVCTDEKS